MISKFARTSKSMRNPHTSKGKFELIPKDWYEIYKPNGGIRNG